MNGSKFDSLLSVAMLVLSAGWVLALSVCLPVPGDSWLIRVGLLGGGLLLVGGLLALVWHRGKCNRRAVRRYIEALCQLDPCDLRADADRKLPPLAPNSPWRALADRVRETLAGYCQRLQDAEHVCTGLEIRAKRATSQGERIKAILSGLADPIIAIDDFNELMLANPAAESLFDLDMESSEDRAVARLLHCQKLVDLLTQTSHRKTAGSRTEEIEIVDGQGDSQWYRISATKLPADTSQAGQKEPSSYGAVAVLRDIGQQKALQKRNAEFVSSVSHEMKTPLAGIKAYVELLVDGDAEDEQTQEEFLEVINSQADRLQRLIDNMLNLARIEAGVVSVSKQNRSLNELLEEAIHVVQPSAEAKRIELVADLSPLYLGVLADRDMLLQAAINLLSNAIKYTREGGRVTLRSRLVDEQVTFEVEDTGVGLSQEDCQRIFEKFYRVKKDKTMASGTGLGLPLAKHIVEDVHSGHLSAASELGVGSRFTVTLPKSGQTP